MEDYRVKLWCDVYVAVANSANCVYESSPSKWADIALAEFDKKFPKPDPAPKDIPEINK